MYVRTSTIVITKTLESYVALSLCPGKSVLHASQTEDYETRE